MGAGKHGGIFLLAVFGLRWTRSDGGRHTLTSEFIARVLCKCNPAARLIAELNNSTCKTQDTGVPFVGAQSSSESDEKLV